MISLRFGAAVHASKLTEDEWNPHCHWVVAPGEPIEAAFVQQTLDEFVEHLAAYAITPFGSSYFVELQFSDPVIGKKCNQAYLRGWRKGGAVAKKKKAANGKSRKRLLCDRMYILPDKSEFFYFSRWDGHGHLVGKVLTEAGFRANEEGFIPLENKIVHRSIVEEGTLVPAGHERFWIGKRPVAQTTAKQRKAVFEVICELRAAADWYGPGDCFHGEPIESVYKAMPDLSEPTIDAAIVRLSADGLLNINGDGADDEFVWVTNLGWRRWSKWDDDYFLEIVNSEAGQDWPDWDDDREFWKDIKPDVWKQLEDEYQREYGQGAGGACGSEGRGKGLDVLPTRKGKE